MFVAMRTCRLSNFDKLVTVLNLWCRRSSSLYQISILAIENTIGIISNDTHNT